MLACRQVKQYEGLNPSKENPDYDIIKRLKQMGKLVSNNSIKHKVPFCPRSNTPLIYKVAALAKNMAFQVIVHCANPSIPVVTKTLTKCTGDSQMETSQLHTYDH